jgi:hypothetical protein
MAKLSNVITISFIAVTSLIHIFVFLLFTLVDVLLMNTNQSIPPQGLDMRLLIMNSGKTDQIFAGLLDKSKKKSSEVRNDEKDTNDRVVISDYVAPDRTKSFSQLQLRRLCS